MKRKYQAATMILFCFVCLGWHPALARVKRAEWIEGKGKGYPVRDKVEIVRDQYGVPHIRAENDRDLFFGLGYAMAQDRFFQMDLLRKAGRGELCSLLGRIKFWKIDFLNADKVLRAFNYQARARAGYAKMPAEAKTLLDAYTAGINRYLRDSGDTIPVYHFLRTNPTVWRAEDSLICADVYGLGMVYGQLGTEYYYTRLMRELGPEKAQYILPEYPADAPVVIKDLPVVKSDPGMEEMLNAMKWILNLGATGLGSNNWVVAPEKSESGAPIISNDPHVPIYPLPTYWYLCQLQGDTFNIIGMMFPGLPAFGAAYNGDIAWTLTNASIDQMDIFIEKVNPENPNQYLYQGEWKDFKIRREEIPLKNGKSFSLEIRESVHGPVMDPAVVGQDLPIKDPDQVFTIRIVDVEMGNFLQGYLDLARAKNWGMFQAGLENMIQGPVAWNHVFADKSGNIGYWLSGRIPIRPDPRGWLARKGWTGDQDWTGYVPLQDLPHLFNPKQKYLATANNRNYPDGYPYYLGTEYYVNRIARIDEVLRSKEKFSLQDMEKLQMDTVPFLARKIVPIIISDLAGAPDKKTAKAVSSLTDWQARGYQAGIDSIGATVYVMIQDQINTLTYDDELKKMSTGANLFGVTGYSLDRIIYDPDNPWFDNVNTEPKETRKDIVRAATILAIKDLEKKFGPDPNNWQWGKLSHSYFYTPMGFIPVTGKRHRIGKYPREGIFETVNSNGGFFLGPLGYVFLSGPTTRMIVDFADPGHFHFNATTGNSENLASGRMANLTPFWVNGQYLTLSMIPVEYEKDQMGRLELSP